MKKRQDIIVPIPVFQWDYASFSHALGSKEPPAPCNVTLEKPGFIDIKRFDYLDNLNTREKRVKDM